MHFSEKDDCNCVLCLELNGGDKYTSVSGDGEEKIIVVEQPKKDRKLPFTYFGMEVENLTNDVVANPAQHEITIITIGEKEITNKEEVNIIGKETQLVAVEISAEEADEDFILEFLENNVINIVYKNTFAYASQLINELQHEYYSEDDPPLSFLEDEYDLYLKNR